MVNLKQRVFVAKSDERKPNGKIPLIVSGHQSFSSVQVDRDSTLGELKAQLNTKQLQLSKGGCTDDQVTIREAGLEPYSQVTIAAQSGGLLLGGMKADDDDYQRVEDDGKDGKKKVADDVVNRSQSGTSSDDEHDTDDDGFKRADSKTRRSSVAFDELYNQGVRKNKSIEQMRNEIITDDSFCDDFSCKKMSRSIAMTYREGQKAKEEAALKAAENVRPRDEEIAREARGKIYDWFKEQWCLLLLGTPFMFAGSVIDMVAPGYVGLILDGFREADEKGWDPVYLLISQFLYITAFTAVCAFFREIIFGLVSQKLGLSIRGQLFSNIVRKDVSFYDNFRTGDMLSRLNSDTQVVQEGLSTNVMMAVKSTCIVMVVFGIMFTFHVKLTFIVMVLILPQILITRVSATFLDSFAVTYQKTKAELSNMGTESLGNIRTVKAFANEEVDGLKFALQNQHVFENGRARSYFWAFFFMGFGLFARGGDLAIIYIVCLKYESWGLTIGQVFSILMYVRTVMANVGSITNNIQAIAKVSGSAYEMAILMVTPNKVKFEGNERPGGADGPTGDINLNTVKFTYPSKDNVPVLKGISIDVKSNQVVALVGHSGCGKSSIIQLIERFYDPADGEVLFSGCNLKNLDNTWYHQKQIALVQQEPILFSCSIRDNICYGVDFSGLSEDEIMERVREACRMSNCLDFIQDEKLFPEGFDSMVGERGVRLSGGQKQRIAIARALVRKPKVILLDEATSALDAESEHQVQKALDQLIANGQQTCIVIAHRLSTIRNANKIVVLKKGEIMEEGTHDELIALDGAYKKLVARQLLTEELGEEVKKGE